MRLRHLAPIVSYWSPALLLSTTLLRFNVCLHNMHAAWRQPTDLDPPRLDKYLD